MRILYTALVLFILAVGVSAQAVAASSAPGLQVVQKKWHAEYRNPALDEDPMRAVDAHNQNERDRRDAIRQNEILSKQGKPQQLPPVSTYPVIGAAPDPWTSYIYEVKFKNDGQKEIRSVSWEYVFFDSETKQEVGRRQFVNKTSIEPRQVKTFRAHSGTPPTTTIDAKADQKTPKQYDEQIVVQSIEYSDGSVWSAAK